VATKSVQSFSEFRLHTYVACSALNPDAKFAGAYFSTFIIFLKKVYDFMNIGKGPNDLPHFVCNASHSLVDHRGNDEATCREYEYLVIRNRFTIASLRKFLVDCAIIDR